jgi:hypothetical protein
MVGTDFANRGAELSDSHSAREESIDPRRAMPVAGGAAGHAWPIAQTVGAELERVRLAHRARRIERVLVSLRARRAERAQAGAVAPALSQAIDDFSRELAQLRGRVSAMPSPPRNPAVQAGVTGEASATAGPGKAKA